MYRKSSHSRATGKHSSALKIVGSLYQSSFTQFTLIKVGNQGCRG